jgi:hypothetical protein
VFLYRFASDLVAECIIPPITSIMMTKDLWIPLLTAVGFQWIAVAMTLALPETLPVIASDQSCILTSDTPGGGENLQNELEREPIRKSEKMSAAKLWLLLQQTKQSFNFIWCDAAAIALLSTFFVSKVGRHSINLLLQYVSKRYQWTLSKARAHSLMIARFSLSISKIIGRAPFLFARRSKYSTIFDHSAGHYVSGINQVYISLYGSLDCKVQHHLDNIRHSVFVSISNTSTDDSW